MQHLSTLLDWIRYATSRLATADIAYGHGTDTPLDEAAALVLGLLNLPYDLSPAYFSAHLTTDESTALRDALDRRINERIPVPYLTHRTLYGGYEFYVDGRVLIPRSPIAELIERDLSPWWQGDAPETILDLCCGSGCIGILAQIHQPQADVILADIDPAALAVAAKNLARYQLSDSIPFLQGDGLAALDAAIANLYGAEAAAARAQGATYRDVTSGIDWILCNPPYVEESEMDDIAAEYRHEPRHALTSGADGLDFTRRLLHQAGDYLSERGLLVLEVGMSGQNLEEAYPDAAFDWAELTRGGAGVCVISADELLAWRDAGIV